MGMHMLHLQLACVQRACILCCSGDCIGARLPVERVAVRRVLSMHDAEDRNAVVLRHARFLHVVTPIPVPSSHLGGLHSSKGLMPNIQALFYFCWYSVSRRIHNTNTAFVHHP